MAKIIETKKISITHEKYSHLVGSIEYDFETEKLTISTYYRAFEDSSYQCSGRVFCTDKCDTKGITGVSELIRGSGLDLEMMIIQLIASIQEVVNIKFFND